MIATVAERSLKVTKVNLKLSPYLGAHIIQYQFVFLKISLRVWSEYLVNSVKIDGEASDFVNDKVENDLYFVKHTGVYSFKNLFGPLT